MSEQFEIQKWVTLRTPDFQREGEIGYFVKFDSEHDPIEVSFLCAYLQLAPCGKKWQVSEEVYDITMAQAWDHRPEGAYGFFEEPREGF